MTVSGIVKSSLIDFPGLVSCVLFVPGCNYDCFYCHNRALVDGPYEVLNPVYIREFLEKRAGLLDGVVISGGEPTLQPDLKQFAQTVKGLGYKLKLDTNGSRPEVVKELLKERLFDYYAVDYKAPGAEYPRICGAGARADKVLETVRLLLDSGADFEVRTTVYPQLREEELVTMARELPVVPRYVLNHYRKPEKYKSRDRLKVEAPPYTQAQIEALAETVKKYQPNVKL
ncbi:MAG TPA: anaerobic ribonucleoside-triphosphate reductase activating protein [Clostridiales bacterium]|jgi:pyruvate formate lyase activating enzyme|nr:anaerobic ribonucleoside-triphosphate reductase activating protein [Clostridiales bacterium]